VRKKLKIGNLSLSQKIKECGSDWKQRSRFLRTLQKSAELLENQCIVLGPEDGISNRILRAESNRGNAAEAKLLDVCAAARRVTAAIFSMRINHYLMAVKRRSDLEEGVATARGFMS
jgi:hypothetical protein